MNGNNRAGSTLNTNTIISTITPPAKAHAAEGDMAAPAALMLALTGVQFVCRRNPLNTPCA